MTNNNLTPDNLQTIWNVHGLGKIEHLSQPSGGAVNRAWIVNNAYVIRFDVIDWGGISRYVGEKWAYDLLCDGEVPVPRVVALDMSKTLAPYDYLILTKMPGKTLSQSILDLPPEAQRRIASTAGEYLAVMHAHTFDQFGLLFEIAAGLPKPDWSSFVSGFYHEYGPQAQELGFLPDGVLARIEALMHMMQPLFAAVQQGTFVHGDYHYANILQENGQITGVLDFEWAMSGDRSWDFRIDDQLEAKSPGSKEAFYAGYTSRRPLPDDHWQRVSFYRVGLYLDYLATFAPDDETEAPRTVPLLMRELDWLEAHL